MNDPIPHEEGRPPPRGWVLVQDQNGKRWWADPATLRPSPERSRLSPEQVARIRRFKATLGAHDTATLEETLSNFARDADPEPEIVIWERIARVFADEVTARGVPSPEEERLIYFAALGCSLVGPDVGQLLSWCPPLKGLRNLAAIGARWRA